jgi:hypothetical protein
VPCTVLPLLRNNNNWCKKRILNIKEKLISRWWILALICLFHHQHSCIIHLFYIRQDNIQWYEKLFSCWVYACYSEQLKREIRLCSLPLDLVRETKHTVQCMLCMLRKQLRLLSNYTTRMQQPFAQWDPIK